LLFFGFAKQAKFCKTGLKFHLVRRFAKPKKHVKMETLLVPIARLLEYHPLYKNTLWQGAPGYQPLEKKAGTLVPPPECIFVAPEREVVT
jgi:hypothetical protein